eukprot:316945-Pleurochrysis_carterae.AAC.1
MHLEAMRDATDTQDVCEESDVAVTGGDMAAGHTGWALDSLIARYGCCLYCWLPKADSFDAGYARLGSWGGKSPSSSKKSYRTARRSWRS